VVYPVLVEINVKALLLLLGVVFVPIKDHVMGLLVSVKTSVTVTRTAVLRNVLVSSVLLLEKNLIVLLFICSSAASCVCEPLCTCADECGSADGGCCSWTSVNCSTDCCTVKT